MKYHPCHEVSRGESKATRKVSFQFDESNKGLNLEKNAAKVWGILFSCAASDQKPLPRIPSIGLELP